MTAPPLPRLAYIAEVPVRAISAGPALLYRLLETYPRDRLIICESDDNLDDPVFQLDAKHARFPLLNRRLSRTRLSVLYGAFTYLTAVARGRRLARQLRPWRPESVLTVAHGYGWLAAMAAARSLDVPLHFIVHDHWQTFITLPKAWVSRAESRFANTYRTAASRMPVSPVMERRYREKYGAAGVIVYPSCSVNAQRLVAPPARKRGDGPFVFAYAGATQCDGQRRALVDLAHAIAPLGARLRVYQTMELSVFKRDGLRTENIDIVPFMRTDALHADLMKNADAMYLPMSYAPEDRENVELCFPSKLTDYTVTGLPILVHAPEYGTATEWVRSNPGIADLVVETESASLATAAHRLMSDESHWLALGHAALAARNGMFSHEENFRRFAHCLTAVNRP